MLLIMARWGRATMLFIEGSAHWKERYDAEQNPASRWRVQGVLIKCPKDKGNAKLVPRCRPLRHRLQPAPKMNAVALWPALNDTLEACPFPTTRKRTLWDCKARLCEPHDVKTTESVQHARGSPSTHAAPSPCLVVLFAADFA